MSAEARRLGRQQTFDVHVARLLAIFQEVLAAGQEAGRVPRLRASGGPGAMSGPHADRVKAFEAGKSLAHADHEPLDAIQEGSSMQAVLLAGGKGTRLRPYTHVLPKPLMPLGDDDPMPIIEVVLRQLARFGFRDVTIITGYLTELIEAILRRRPQVRHAARYRRETTPAGDGRRPDSARAPTEPVLVINGDILTTLDFAEMYAFHRRRGAAATIASYPREVKIDFGVLLFGDDPHVLTGYQEKPEYSFQVSMGVYILDPIAWDYLDAGPAVAHARLLESMRRSGHDIHCYRQECYWLDIGRHDDYDLANEIFESRRAQFLGDPAGQETQDRARPVTVTLLDDPTVAARRWRSWPPTWSGRSPSAT